jgi:hypothetical protein
MAVFSCSSIEQAFFDRPLPGLSALFVWGLADAFLLFARRFTAHTFAEISVRRDKILTVALTQMKSESRKGNRLNSMMIAAPTRLVSRPY